MEYKVFEIRSLPSGQLKGERKENPPQETREQ